MQVELWDITKIKPYEKNPRRNHAVEAVARSISEFGVLQPPVVDRFGVIIAGHGRYLAAKQRGMKQLPVVVAKGLTPAQVKAYRIADNKTAESSTWDNDRLVQELLELRELQFDVDLVGFSADEMQALLGTDVATGLVDPDVVPEPPDRPITRPGDLWTLDDHRLHCADAANTEDIDRLLAGEPIHLVNTDPPFGVGVKPRSNNAIAAGFSTFRASHRPRRDVRRHPEKAAPTTRKLRARIDRS